MARYDLPRAAEGPLRLVQLFVNTVDHEHGREWLATPADLSGWLAEHGLGEVADPGWDGLERARAVREALRGLLRANGGGAPGANDAAVVNRAARRGGLVVRAREDGTAVVEAGAHGLDGALGRVLAVALAAMLDGSWARLKTCRRCRWVFWDGSRNRSAAWCSMQLCGNRVKTRAYRRRAREGA
jgi:predicted RNA-binding Zn ribbon-like protein